MRKGPVREGPMRKGSVREGSVRKGSASFGFWSSALLPVSTTALLPSEEQLHLHGLQGPDRLHPPHRHLPRRCLTAASPLHAIGKIRAWEFYRERWRREAERRYMPRSEGIAAAMLAVRWNLTRDQLHTQLLRNSIRLLPS